MTDQQIIELLQAGEDHKAFRRLYNHLRPVERWVKANSGSREEALDIFQEALIILWRNCQKEDFKLTSALGTYITAICKNLWMAELRRKAKTHGMDIEVRIPELDEGMQEAMAREARFIKAEQAIASLGEKCQKLLIMFYHQKVSMKEIAAMLGFSSDKSAKVQKFKCLEKARAELQSLTPIQNPGSHA